MNRDRQKHTGKGNPERRIPQSGLRKEAEERLKFKMPAMEEVTDLNLHKMIEELHIHQIELEMQNEELRRVQKEIEDSRRRYSDLYDFAPVGYLAFNKDGLILEANLTATGQLSLERSALINKSFYEYIDRDDRDKFYLYLRHVTGGKTRQSCEVKLTSNDNVNFYALLDGICVEDPEGNITCRTTLTDITRLKKAEVALRTLSFAVEQSQTSIMITNTRGIIEYVNPKFTETTGYTREEVIRKNPNILKSGEHPPDFYRAIWDAITSGETWRGDICNRKKNGETIWELLSISPIKDTGGETTHFISVKIDDTERRQAEKMLKESKERYHRLIDTVPDAIIVHCDGEIVYANPAAAGMFAAHDVGKVLGRSMMDFVHPDFKEAVLHRMRHALEKGATQPMIEEKLLRIDRTALDAEVSTLRTAYNGKPAIQFVIRDITQRRHMENELMKARKLESLGILAGGIAHDFNNLLTGIAGNVSLAKTYTGPEDKVYMRLVEAEKASRRATDLTQQLLTFSRGGAPLKRTVSIRGLIRDSIDLALRGSNVRCDIAIADDLWSVEVDEGQISQVMNNIVINAHQAMPAGGIVTVRAANITISTNSATPLKDGRYIKISIEDHGIGIPGESLQKIFDPYFTSKQTGSGLGLATSYSIIKNHNGLIDVESELGRGTTFYIYLPAATKEILSEKEAANEVHMIGKRRILVMDDEEIIRELAGEMLTHVGCEVSFAGDGIEAVELYRKARESGEPFDAVIMDLTIPGGMGGKETIKELLEIDPDVRAIVSSGYSNDPIMADFRTYGFRGVIAKPYKIQEVSRVMRDVLSEDGGRRGDS